MVSLQVYCLQASLMWHASIDDEESCTTIIASIKELEERMMVL